MLALIALTGFIGLCAVLWPDDVKAAEHRVNELGLKH